jgi:hypothetical protein
LSVSSWQSHLSVSHAVKDVGLDRPLTDCQRYRQSATLADEQTSLGRAKTLFR